MTLLSAEQKILFDKAINLHKEGKIQEAIDLYISLFDNNKNNPQLLFLLGTAYVQIKDTSKGIELLKKSISLKPENALAHSNLGNALREFGHFEEALESYNKAIQINSNYADAYSNRGIVLQEMKRYEEALESYNKAIQIKPDHFFAYGNRGITLKDLDRYEEALNSYDKAIKINPNYIEAFNNKGNVFKNLKRYEEALENYKKVMELKLDYDYIIGKVLHLSMFLCDWSNFDSLTSQINKALKKRNKVIEPFSYLGVTDDAKLSHLAAEIYMKDKLTDKSKTKVLPNKYNHKKPRIGYFSSDFHDHPVLHLMMDVFKNHDKSIFDIFAFSFGPEKKDKWREEVKNYFTQFKDINKISDSEVVNLARSVELDIAVDLSGLTGSSRSQMFSQRLAPIQINYLGYPGTIGAEYMDYILADEIVIPNENLSHYSEKVIYFSKSYQANIKLRKISQKNLNRSDFGLPENAFVYCSFNNNYKITPETFDSWMTILKKVENSVIWILKSNELAIKNLKKEAKIKGVDPNRIIFASFLPNDEHLKRIALADLFLDTYPYNAHTTASDAIRMGVPIITLCGNSFASRVGASILNCVDMNELITKNRKDYNELAIEIGLNPEKFVEIKNRLRDKVANSSFFDSLEFTKNLENTYLKLLKR